MKGRKINPSPLSLPLTGSVFFHQPCLREGQWADVAQRIGYGNLVEVAVAEGCDRDFKEAAQFFKSVVFQPFGKDDAKFPMQIDFRPPRSTEMLAQKKMRPQVAQVSTPRRSREIVQQPMVGLLTASLIGHRERLCPDPFQGESRYDEPF